MPTGIPGSGKPRPYDKRKQHKATGKPKGGPQPGSGRPRGATGLPTSSVGAIESLKLRVPENATEAQKETLKLTEDAIVKVMLGKVHGSIASAVLLAARTAREEICGPITKKVEVEAKVGLGKLLDEVKVIEKEELPPVEEQKKLPVVAKGPIIRKKAAQTVLSAVIDEVNSSTDTEKMVGEANGDEQ